MGGGGSLALLDVLVVVRGDVRGVDVVALRRARPLVGDRPEEAKRVQAEQGPRQTDNGLDTGALLGEALPGVLEVVRIVLALEAVSEGRRGQDTSNDTEEDAAGEEHEQEDAVSELPVEDGEQQVEDGREETVASAACTVHGDQGDAGGLRLAPVSRRASDS